MTTTDPVLFRIQNLAAGRNIVCVWCLKHAYCANKDYDSDPNEPGCRAIYRHLAECPKAPEYAKAEARDVLATVDLGEWRRRASP